MPLIKSAKNSGENKIALKPVCDGAKAVGGISAEITFNPIATINDVINEDKPKENKPL